MTGMTATLKSSRLMHSVYAIEYCGFSFEAVIWSFGLRGKDESYLCGNTFQVSRLREGPLA